MTDTPTLIINATYRVHPDEVNAFKALASRMAAAAIKRDGCIFLKAAQDTAEPTVFYTFEGWRDQTALQVHAASADFQGVMQEAGNLKITDRSLAGYTVSGSMPLDMPT